MQLVTAMFQCDGSEQMPSAAGIFTGVLLVLGIVLLNASPPDQQVAI